MSRMNAAIQEIQRSSDETSKIIKTIDEIAAACQEQAHDLDQVNTAIGRSPRQNAANAEESASVSEELVAQAAAMNDIVG
jgi:methyl-accepting chemotaxis protein